ncbi:MAG: type IV secretion system DNA-binding domain-containing protein [Candidatus Falkowbacteria bacterium]|nr:type IV secretion system DNA-binding domain-containing protein [Candidatus Falkowbacteria bacterium]
MNSEIAVFAQTTYRNEFKKFGIKTDDRRRHMYLIGKTGMGKSTILENMIIDDIRAGRGVAVVDPHGDLAEKIIEFIPRNRIDDVVYLNPADIDYPIAFNVVEQVEPHLQHLVASGLIGVFKKLWADSWGPRLEYILRNAILAILDYPGSTLLGVVRMLSDKTYRKKVVTNIKDPMVKSFWEKEFAGYADKFASEAVSPIQNKVGQFLSSSLMRNVIGQVKSSIDIRKIMDEGKILIMNLSKGRIGEDNSALLGAMMITKIQLAAMSRVDIAESERKDFYLYIDEFQNFSTDSFANILSEARKYRLNLIMAHQYIEQLGDTVKAAVFGNVGTLIVFRVGATDAEDLVKEFTPTFTEEDIVNLPKYEMYLRLMIDGITSNPFSARGLPPLRVEEKTGNTQKIIDVSREKYSSPRALVEERIMKWHESEEEDKEKELQEKKSFTKPGNQNFPPRNNYIPPSSVRTPPVYPPMQAPGLTAVNPAVSQEKSNQAPAGQQTSKPVIQRPVVAAPRVAVVAAPTLATTPVSSPNRIPPGKISTECSNCGAVTFVSFQPDGVRPVYCQNCLTLKKEEKRVETEARQKLKQAELTKLKEAEKRAENYVEEMFEKAANTPEPVSLSSLSNLRPVNFKGREIKEEPKTNSSNLSVSAGEEFGEGEEIDFSRIPSSN